MHDEIAVKVHSYGPGRSLALVYFDPVSGRKKAKSSGTTDWREAERLAGELEKELQAGRYVSPSKITWADFRKRYETERLAILSASAQQATATGFNHLERVLNPDRLVKVTTPAMSRFIAQLRASQTMKESSIACYLRHIKAALRWASRQGLLVTVPTFDMPKSGEAKGRPITAEEFDRMLAAVPKVKRKNHATWERFLNGLWLSGLRLGEAVILSWDPDAPFAVDLSGRYPAFRIEAKAQKARRDERLPMTPDFAEWLLQTPEDERIGRVFKLPMAIRRMGHGVCDIGQKAGVVVARDLDTGKVKFASAHDLRRSFGTRWAKRVMPAVLQRLMRHANISTTMKYYVGIGADEVAAGLWAQHPGPGNGPGNIALERPAFAGENS